MGRILYVARRRQKCCSAPRPGLSYQLANSSYALIVLQASLCVSAASPVTDAWNFVMGILAAPELAYRKYENIEVHRVNQMRESGRWLIMTLTDIDSKEKPMNIKCMTLTPLRSSATMITGEWLDRNIFEISDSSTGDFTHDHKPGLPTRRQSQLTIYHWSDIESVSSKETHNYSQQNNLLSIERGTAFYVVGLEVAFNIKCRHSAGCLDVSCKARHAIRTGLQGWQDILYWCNKES